MNSYKFSDQHQVGQGVEHAIYGHFKARYVVIPATPALQSRGIDFVFHDRETGAAIPVEIKADTKARYTGNAFIETISVARDGQPHIPGWAYTSQADELLYCLPNVVPPTVYRLPFLALRERLPGWLDSYPARTVHNQDFRRGDYNTFGVLVPLDELKAIATEVIAL